MFIIDISMIISPKHSRIKASVVTLEDIQELSQ